MATPVRRNASHSQVARYQQVAAATAGSWRSTHNAAGRPAKRPAADAGRRGQLVGFGRRARVEERDRRPGRLAAGVDGRERRAVAVDADRDDLGDVRGAQGPDGAHDRGPPGARILLGPAAAAVDVERVAAARQAQQPAVEGDETGLDLGRAEIEAEDRRLAVAVIASDRPVRAWPRRGRRPPRRWRRPSPASGRRRRGARRGSAGPCSRPRRPRCSPGPGRGGARRRR